MLPSVEACRLAVSLSPSNSSSLSSVFLQLSISARGGYFCFIGGYAYTGDLQRPGCKNVGLSVLCKPFYIFLPEREAFKMFRPFSKPSRSHKRISRQEFHRNVNASHALCSLAGAPDHCRPELLCCSRDLLKSMSLG